MRWQDEGVQGAAETGAEAAEAAPNVFIQGGRGAIARALDGDVTQADLVALWVAIGLPIVKALVLIVVVLLVARWAKVLTTRAATKARVEITLSKFIGNIVRWAILLLGALTVLQTFGVQATSFAAAIAALGFAIGMAFSGSLGNVAAGMMLLIFRPYRVGNYVTVGGVSGTVDEIELFTTTLDTPDNTRVIVPNSQIISNVIENVSFNARRRIDVNVGIVYNADVDKTREVLMAAARSVEGRLQTEEIGVVLTGFGASSVDWQVRVWTPSADYLHVQQALMRAIKMHLDEAQVAMPYPQRDVNVPGAIRVRIETASEND